MKSCPTCHRTYSDESITFCLVDGSILSAPYEPDMTQPIAAARITNPPPTEILPNRDAVPPTVRSPFPLNPPVQTPTSQLAQVSPDQKSGKFKRFIKRALLGIIIGAPTGLIIALNSYHGVGPKDDAAIGGLVGGTFIGAIVIGIIWPGLRALIKYARK